MVFDAVPARSPASKKGAPDRILQREWRVGAPGSEQARLPLGLSPDQLGFAFATAEGAVAEQDRGASIPPPGRARSDQGGGQPARSNKEPRPSRKVALELVGTPIAANLIGIFFMKEPAHPRLRESTTLTSNPRKSIASAWSGPA